MKRAGPPTPAVAFDDLKIHNGRRYTGMPVGGRHEWLYPDGLWQEQKVAPDVWRFRFSAVKHRTQAAPFNSGAPRGAQYHWYLMAHQRVRKLDDDSYHTLMQGVKHKIAHKRPHWRKWSTSYPDQEGERARVIAVLEDTLRRLRADEVAPTSTLDAYHDLVDPIHERVAWSG